MHLILRGICAILMTEKGGMILEQLFIAIDGGGTKTEAVICDRSGKIISHRLAGGSNLNATDAQSVADNLRIVTKDVENGYLFAGIAGALNCGERLHQMLPHKDTLTVSVGSDAVNMLSAGLLHADGCGIICGTGSVCFARIGETLHRIGGWGYLFDGKGSGYDIGRDAISAVLRQFDGRGKATLLSDMIVQKYGHSAADHLSAYYQAGRDEIASHSTMVFAAAEAGDEIACDIVRTNMAALAEEIACAARHFDGTFPVTLTGGILTNCPLALKLLQEAAPKQATLTVCPAPPVFGALVEARKLAGLITTEDDRAEFISQYHRIKKETQNG